MDDDHLHHPNDGRCSVSHEQDQKKGMTQILNPVWILYNKHALV